MIRRSKITTSMRGKFALLLLFSLCSGRSVGLLQYVDNALWDPSSYEGLQAWPKNRESREMSELGGNWYNPAIVLLPRRLRRDMSERFKREVAFLIAFKRNLEKGNCENLVLNETGNVRFDVKGRHEGQQFLLADSQLVTFGEPLTVHGDNWIRLFLRKCGDVRLEAKKDRILAHAHGIIGPLQRRYAFWWLDLKVRGDEVVLAASTFSNPDVVAPKQSWLDTPAQNLGVLWSGRSEDSFNVAYWLGKTIDVRPGIPPDEFPDDEGNETDPVRFLVNGLDEPYDRNVHGNGSPVLLDDICPGLAVAIGHSHLDTELNASQGIWAEHNQTKWGNTYIHNLILFNSSTFHTLEISPPFCFPSVASAPKANDKPLCDVIQFVSSFFRDGAHDILFGYGVNDCESAFIRIPIIAIIDFVMGGMDQALAIQC